jgi:hypothetical protein
MAYSGKFRPRNIKKYKGDPNNIFYRSSWECKYMSFLDSDPRILEWSSEEIVVPYTSPVDGKRHRYFVDFFVKMQTVHGPKVFLIEIKPKKQSQEPKQRKRITKQYIQEVATWGVNQAKWQAATEYALDRGWEFQVLTEDDLKIYQPK